MTEEAYEKLKEHKREGESFTDTIIRLTGGNRNIMEGFGAMADVEGFREAVEDTRNRLDDDLQARSKR